MQRATVVRAGVLAVGIAIAVLTGCESTGEPPKNWWLSVQSASYCVEGATVKVTVPAGQSGTLEFKDANGNPIAPRSHIDGGVTIEVPVPVGAVAYDWRVKTGVGEEAGAAPGLGLASAPPPFTPALTPGLPSVRRPGISEYFMGCMTTTFDPSGVNYAYALRAVSDDEVEAEALMQEVLDGKVGTPVDPAVRVDAFLELTVRNGQVQMVSSMPKEFGQYTIFLGGAVVADLAAGANATVTHLANGWVSITSILPLSSVQLDHTLYLVQRAVGATEDTSLWIQA